MVRAVRESLRLGLVSVCLVVVACGDDGGARCDRLDVATATLIRGFECTTHTLAAGGAAGACAASAAEGHAPRIALRADGAAARAWLTASDGLVLELEREGLCGTRVGVPSRGPVHAFDVTIDEVSADVAWHDDAGVHVLVLRDDEVATVHDLAGMRTIQRWSAASEGRRVSLPGPAGHPAIWRDGVLLRDFPIDADKGALAIVGARVAFGAEGGGFYLIDLDGFPSVRGLPTQLSPRGLRAPQVAWFDGDVLVAWEDLFEERPIVRLVRVEGSGTQPEPNLLGSVGFDGHGPALVTVGTRVVLAAWVGDPTRACAGLLTTTWLDTALRSTGYDEWYGAALGADLALASGGGRVVLATTALGDGCASPRFTTIAEDGPTEAVLPGAWDER